MVLEAETEAYGLDPNFERAAVTALCQQPRLYGRLGGVIDPAAIGHAAGRLALQTAKVYASETGGGPDSVLVILQRLKRMYTEGRVKHEQIMDVLEYFDAAEDAGLPSEESIVAELGPVLKQRQIDTTMLNAVDAHGQRKDLDIFANSLLAASRIGTIDDSLGDKLGSASFATIAAVQNLDRLPTDVPEIDLAMEGGLPRQCLGVLIAISGGGKSMMLSHIAGVSAYRGVNVAYATLELPKHIVLARILANLSGVPINHITNGNTKKAQAFIKDMEDNGRLGDCHVKDFTPQVATVPDVLHWVEDLQQRYGIKIDAVVTDYADKLGFGKGTKDSDTYTGGRVVYEALRIDAVDNNRWHYTASQAQGRDKKSTLIGIEDVADSMNKIRVADFVMTLNIRDDGDSLVYFIAKNRLGPGGQTIGPIPHDWVHGRTAEIVRGFAADSGEDAVDETPW